VRWLEEAPALERSATRAKGAARVARLGRSQSGARGAGGAGFGRRRAGAGAGTPGRGGRSAWRTGAAAGARTPARGGWTARRTGAAAARGAGGAGASVGLAAGGGGAAARTCRTTVCREITRGAGGVAVRQLQADPHGSSGAARRDGLARIAAKGAVPMQADHGPPGGRGDGYSVASSEGEAA
jgi:hypothetical protein